MRIRNVYMPEELGFGENGRECYVQSVVDF